MKKIRLLALALVLVALAANGMVSSGTSRGHLLCASVPAPNTLCSGSTDTGCDDFCSTNPSCADLFNVHGSCSTGGGCTCHGTINP